MTIENRDFQKVASACNNNLQNHSKYDESPVIKLLVTHAGSDASESNPYSKLH